LNEALELLSYDNARGVLKRAGEMVRTLVAVGAGRAAGQVDGRQGGHSPRAAEHPSRQGEGSARSDRPAIQRTDSDAARSSVHPST
jgi:hypothetical protein